MFFGSKAGGEAVAVMYTIAGSAHRHGLDQWRYLDDLLRRLAEGEQDLHSLLPDIWVKTHTDLTRTYRQQESLERAAQTKARRRKLAKRG